MLLAVDVGNTLTDIGLFDGDELQFVFKTRSDVKRSYDEFEASFSLFLKAREVNCDSVDEIILSSVVPALTRVYEKILAKFFSARVWTIGPRLKTGIALHCDNPKEVGSDLIADASGAFSRFGKGCLVVDCGTATKFVLVGDRSFEGCVIAPGIGMCAEALSAKAANLPEVGLSIPQKVLGKNTVDCMNSGLTYGPAFLIQGMVDAIEKEQGKPLPVVLTGGYASIVKPLLPYPYVENLLLEGLREIAKRNRK